MYLKGAIIAACLLQMVMGIQSTERQLLLTSFNKLHNINVIQSIQVHRNGTIVYAFSNNEEDLYVDHDDPQDGYNRFARYHDELTLL